jgi:hypothetical protein
MIRMYSSTVLSTTSAVHCALYIQYICTVLVRHDCSCCPVMLTSTVLDDKAERRWPVHSSARCSTRQLSRRRHEGSQLVPMIKLGMCCERDFASTDRASDQVTIILQNTSVFFCSITVINTVMRDALVTSIFNILAACSVHSHPRLRPNVLLG